MTTPTELLEQTTGELCPGCEREVLIVFGAADELHLECDCGHTLVSAA